MNISKNFVIQKIGESYYAVSLIPNSAIGNAMVKLNDTAYFMWKRFEEGLSVSETARALCSEYSVNEEKALSDVKGFAEKLAGVGILEGIIDA